MGIWQFDDFLFSLIWAVFAIAIHYIAAWIEGQPESDNETDFGKKITKYGIIAIRWMGYGVAVMSVGTLALPLLDALLTALFGTAFDLFNKYGGLAIIIIFIVAWWKSTHPKSPAISAAVNDVDVELARQRAIDMQGYALGLMLQVLIAISSFTPVIRPRNTHDIEVRSTDGASFYMKDDIVIYQAEAEIEGEIAPEVEDTIQREAQRYAQKYITDYPMLISPEAGGRAPVEVLGVKNCGSRVLIDFVFTTTKAIPIIDARRRARVERQMKQERPAPYTDPDYGE